MLKINIEINDEMIKEASKNEAKVSIGHLGTHIDLKGKQFKDCSVKGIVFKCEDNIEIKDIDLSLIKENYFVIFNTNHINKYLYGSKEYYQDYSILDKDLIEELIKRNVSFIGIDGPGIRKGKEHPLMDAYLASKNIFVIENLCNLDKLEAKTIYDIDLNSTNKIDDGMPLDILIKNYNETT